MTGINGFLGASTPEDTGATAFLGGESSIRSSRSFRLFAGGGGESGIASSVGADLAAFLRAGGLNGLNIAPGEDGLNVECLTVQMLQD